MRLKNAMKGMGLMWACDQCGFHSPSWFYGYHSPFYGKRFCRKGCCTRYEQSKEVAK